MTAPAIVWPPFIRASLWLAITAGFGLGGALFAAQAMRVPIGLWWLAAAQAHGHIQLFGWAGLMVLGVGFHFLPRLRGAALGHQEQAGAVLALLLSGLVLRALVQPLLAMAAPAAPIAVALRAGLACSGVLELAGASLALWMLAWMLHSDPPVRTRTGLWPVLPFFASAFVAFWLALGANLAGLVAAALAGDALVPAWADELTIELAFYGFLVPVSMAMAVRTFPLFLRTPLPNLPVLRAGLALLLAGLALRAGGELAEAVPVAGLGGLCMAAAFGLFVLALGVFAPRRPLPRQAVRPLCDPIQLHVLSAYLWLVFAAVLLAWSGVAALGGAIIPVPPDAERHALGAGFVTLLILGLGVYLLPAFANRPLRSRALVWATLALGNAAALLRVAPLFLPAAVTPSLGSTLLSMAGLAGLAAIAAFGVNVSAVGNAAATPRRTSVRQP